MLDLHRLRLLQRFSATGTIAATAAELGYSASAVSQQLAALERETGVTLLDRTAKAAALTEAGRLLADRARDLLAAADAAEADLATLTDRIGGRFTVSTVPSLAPIVARQVAELQRAHPELEVRVGETSQSDAAARILDRAVDLAIVDDWGASASTPAGVGVVRLAREAVLLALPAGPVPDGPIRREALGPLLAGCTWICAPAGQPSRIAGDALLGDARAIPARRWEFDGLATIGSLVALGHGAALLPRSVAAGLELESRCRPLDPPLARGIVALMRTTSRSAPAVARLVDAIAGALRSDSSQGSDTDRLLVDAAAVDQQQPVPPQQVDCSSM